MNQVDLETHCRNRTCSYVGGLLYHYTSVKDRTEGKWRPGLLNKHKPNVCVSRIWLKKIHSIRVENYILFSRHPKNLSLGYSLSVQFSSVQSLSHDRLFATPWIAARQAFLSITNSRSLPKPMSIESVMPSNHLILCHPLLFSPSIFPSVRVFSQHYKCV